MLPEWVWNPGPLTYESAALPIALRGPTTGLSPLWIVNSYSEFQVNIFSNNRDIRLHLENSK